MAKIELPTNTSTKIALPRHGSVAEFGGARFGSARFGRRDNLFPKIALPTNTFTKQTLTNLIT